MPVPGASKIKYESNFSICESIQNDQAETVHNCPAWVEGNELPRTKTKERVHGCSYAARSSNDVWFDRPNSLNAHTINYIQQFFYRYTIWETYANFDRRFVQTFNPRKLGRG